MDNETKELAEYYDQLGRDLFQKTAGMADGSSQYGVGSKLRTGFTDLVQKIMGKLRGARSQKKAGKLRRRKK